LTPERRTERLYKPTYTSHNGKPCNIRRELTYHNNPKEKSDIINAEKTTVNVNRGDINAEKTAINDRGDYAYRGAINDKRLCRRIEELSTTEDCQCHVSLNIGTVILVSDSLLLLIKFSTCQN